MVVFRYHAFVNRHKGPSSYFVANLAFADVIVCLTVYRIGINDSFLYLYEVGNLPETLRTLSYISRALSVALSGLALSAVTYDRYLYSKTSTLFVNNDLEENSYNTWLCMDLVFGDNTGITVIGSFENEERCL